MKKIGYFIIILWSVISCAEEKKKQPTPKRTIEPVKEVVQENLIEPYTTKTIQLADTAFINPEDFYYEALDSFDLKGWYYGKIMDKLKSLTKEKIAIYFQDVRIDTTKVYLNNWKYFSLQKATTDEKILTILKGDESCCFELHYLIYNENNELLSDHIVAGTGGDAGWSYEAYGKFVNDSTYVLTRVDMENDDVVDEKSPVYIDSLITTYRFNKYEPFDTISQQKFETKKKISQ